jgi:hypothetical protein
MLTCVRARRIVYDSYARRPLLPFLAVNRGKGVGRAAVQAARLIHLI